MKPINIFRTGQHTDASGKKLDFTAADLQGLVDSYDAQVFRAPIVAGHPTDNGPAFGWISDLSQKSGKAYATTEQVNQDFSEAVKAGAYQNISASLYTPDSPNNPKPGRYYLRHVGFLGATPPAIKGLEPIKFAEGEEGVVEFMAAYSLGGIAQIFRGLRDWIIESSGIETANKVIPAYAVEDLEHDARAKPDEPASQARATAFTETTDGAMTMTPEELRAAQDKLSADRAAMDASFAERETAIKTSEDAIKEARNSHDSKEIKAFAEKLVTDGKCLPAQKADLVRALAALPNDSPVEFSEDGKTIKETPRQTLMRTLEAGAKVVSYGENRDGHGANVGHVDAVAFSEQIIAHRAARAAQGIHLSASQAATELKSKQEQK